MSGFTAAQTARLAGCSDSQLRYWARTGLVRPSGPRGGYEFSDLVALRVVTSLLDAGLPLGRVRTALSYLRDAGDDLAGLRLVTDGATVWACRDDGQILDALREGQLALFVSVEQFAASVEADVRAFDAERRAFVADLVARERSAAAHPSRGAPSHPGDRPDA
jgi:DNA-binding transcriptional MerR regulator